VRTIVAHFHACFGADTGFAEAYKNGIGRARERLMLILALMAVAYSVPIGPPSMTNTTIAVDAAGNSYIAGYADQTGTAAFVSKLDSATGKVIWSAALQNTQIKSIAVNGNSEVYLGGTTNNASVGYLAKLSADGSKVQFSTSLGHAQTAVTALALDATGYVYVTGDTNDRNFPTTPGAFQPKAPVTPYQGNIFLAKFTADASTLIFSTMLDGSLEEHARAIAVDTAGNIYIAGNTYSTDFPVTPGAYQTSLNASGLSGFVMKVDSSGKSLAYSTLLPSGIVAGVGIDTTGNAYVASSDGVVRKLNPAGAALLWQTAVTGTAGDRLTALAIDTSGNSYLTGSTKSANLPLKAPLQACHFAGMTNPATDAFLTRLDSSGNITAATYLGDSGNTGGVGIATDPAGAVYLAGPMIAVKINPALSPAQAVPFACWSNAATLTAATVVPGGLVSLFGSGLGPDQAAGLKLDANGRVSSTLADTQVLFDGVPAPLLYVQSGQINAVAPFELDGRITTEICVIRSNARLGCLNSQVTGAGFSFFNGNDGSPIVVNQDGTINSPDHPTTSGNTVLLFGTGAGTTIPTQADGEVTAGASPQSTAQITALFENGSALVTPPFGGFPRLQTQYANATVAYIGPAPAIVAGVTQLNLQVPALQVSGRLSVNFTFQWHGVLSPATAFVSVRF
jgi:uncharacterized protein (TIGR03437 family)